MVEDRKIPFHLMWLDLETSGLDPYADHIIELAFVLTEFEYPYNTRAPISRLQLHSHAIKDWVFDPPFEYHSDDVYENSLSPFIREMHTKSGLLEERRRLPPEFRQLPSFFEKEVLLPMSENWPTDKDEKVMLAGSSVHFDLGFMRTKFPAFAKRLSHRVYDVSAVRAFCNSLGMPCGPKPAEAHRANEDVLASIKLANECVAYLDSSSFKDRLSIRGGVHV